MSEVSERPTTGDPEMDKVVEEKFVHALELVEIILSDLAPEIETERKHKIAVNILINIWRPMAEVITAGIIQQSAEELRGA